MLYLYQSNRLETLAALFAGLHRQLPLADALTPEEIVVQSQGMRRYLNQYLAQHNGIAANLRFSLPAGLSWQLMRTLLPGIPDLGPFAPEVMRWRLLALFQSPDFQTASSCPLAHAALQSYLNSGETAAYQLAGQLADVFDQYLVYRPQWIQAWQQHTLVGLGDEEHWQAELWRYLDTGDDQALHRVALWQQLLAALSAEQLPERYFVFGIATMAPMYLQLLQALSEHCDVHIFALNPSSSYWGNIIEAAQILRSGDDIDLSQSGHPLLASLGKQGRDFFDALAEAGVAEEHNYYPPQPTAASLLAQLQYDIQTLQLPDSRPQQPQDNSIRIRSAHSPLRELQILKDELLGILTEHPDWQPHDIAVLTPNIEPYSPYIEAVFGQQQGSAQALPYSLSDVKLGHRQPLLHALAQILELFGSRFETDRLLALLESPPVLRRFDIHTDDLPLLHDTVAALNIHWGTDEQMRRQHGAADNLFTWQQGLERLALGWLLPESDDPLWQGISAWHSDPNHISLLSRFSALITALSDSTREWQQPADTADWCQRTRQLISHLLAPDEHDQAALQQLEQALARWQEEAALAGFTQPLSSTTAIRHLQRFLDSESDAGFLRGGITFCSMVPMRSLPFKVICLLGLNDGDFPRQTKAASFDLIARHPQKGDRARRDDDRYLFLEAIISARDILYLSYLGRSIRNNEILAPSALLSELTDTLATMSGGRSSDYAGQHIRQHPLQAFSTHYFRPDNPDRSSRSDYADALNHPHPPAAAFYSDLLPDSAADNHISQNDFLRFWQNPVRAWLQHTLGWQSPYLSDSQAAAEPFEPQQTQPITAAYTDARRHNRDFNSTERRLNAESLLPAGELGKLWQQRFQNAAKALDPVLCQSPKQPPQPYTLTLDGYTLSGSLNHCYQHGQIFFLDQSPHAPARLSLLLQHLIFCAVAPAGSDTPTHLLLPGETETLPPIPAQEARQLLALWLQWQHNGRSRPLPFFAKTSLAAAAVVRKHDDHDKALQEARKHYYGSKKSKGQCDYTEVALVFGRDEQPPIENPLFWHLIEQLLLPLLQTLQPETPAE